MVQLVRARYRSSKQVFARLSIEFGFQEDSQKTFPRSCLHLLVKDYDGFLYVSMQDNQIISNKAFGYLMTFNYCRAGEAAEKETLRSLAASRIVYRSKAVTVYHVMPPFWSPNVTYMWMNPHHQL